MTTHPNNSDTQVDDWLDKILQDVRRAVWNSGWNSPSDDAIAEAKKLIHQHIDKVVKAVIGDAEMVNPLHFDHDTDDDYGCAVCKKAHARNKLRAEQRLRYKQLKGEQ